MKVESYLEFGRKKGKGKTVYDLRTGQQAYEFFMVSRYLKDIMAYKTGKVRLIHHKEDLVDNTKKYAALVACKRALSPLVFYEVGSSLMGVIDSLEYLNKRFKMLNIKKTRFLGVDNSDIMNFGASVIHNNYYLKLYEKIKLVKCDLFFAKGVSLLYAFSDEKLFCDVLKKSKISIFDYTFSLKDSIKDNIGTGKKVTFLSLDKCKKQLQGSGRELVLFPSKRIDTKSKEKVSYECVYGDKKTIKKYLKLLDTKFKIKY